MLIAIVTIAYLLVALTFVAYMVLARDKSHHMRVRKAWDATVAVLPKRFPVRPVPKPYKPEGDELSCP